jgi:hypothetical protein
VDAILGYSCYSKYNTDTQTPRDQPFVENMTNHLNLKFQTSEVKYRSKYT